MTRVLFYVGLATVCAAASACGGSSSETPFPLEPDFSRADAGAPEEPRYVIYSGRQNGSDAGNIEPADEKPSE